MSWNDLLINTKVNQTVRNKLNQIDPDNQYKHIGLIPIYWNSLDIYHHNKPEKCLQSLSLGSDISGKKKEIKIKEIESSNDIFLINRQFYLLEDDHFPVFEYSHQEPFTWTALRGFFIDHLNNMGFKITNFEFFNIYSMKNFHCFVAILDQPQKEIKSDLETFKNLNWKILKDLEPLFMNNNEYINSYMKVSQNRYYSQTLWNLNLKGLLTNNLSIGLQEIPFNISLDQAIATLSNNIDQKSNSDKSRKQYFKFVKSPEYTPDLSMYFNNISDVDMTS